MVTVLNKDNITDAGVFLTRQLEQRLPKVYAKKYPALKFGNGELLPATADLEVGAESVIEEIMDTVGQADNVADQVDDIPISDAYIKEFKFPVTVKAAAIRYSVRELAAAQLGKRNIRGMREMSARRSIEERMNKLSAYGESGITGMLTDPGVPIDSSISTNYYDSAVTADALIDFFTSKVTSIVESTNMVEEPDTIVVPVRLHEIITNKRIPDSSSTVKQFILENNTWIRQILPANEVSGAQLQANGIGNGSKDRILIYPKNPETVQRLFEPLTVLPAQLRGLQYIVIMLQASTGAIWHFPGSSLVLEIPNS